MGNAFTKRDYGNATCIHGVRFNEDCAECPQESVPAAEPPTQEICDNCEKNPPERNVCQECWDNRQSVSASTGGAAGQDARAKLERFLNSCDKCGKENAENVICDECLVSRSTPAAQTHKWEPDFSDGESPDNKTCGVCGTTHQSPVEDAELIEKQRLRICVLLGEIDKLQMAWEWQKKDMPLLAKQLSREYNFSTQEDRTQAMRMGAELFNAGRSLSAAGETPRKEVMPNESRQSISTTPDIAGDAHPQKHAPSERAEFEKWGNAKGTMGNSWNPAGYYENPLHQAAWQAWLAARGKETHD